MQGIEATFDGLSFEGGRDSRKSLLHMVLGAAALASVGCAGWMLNHLRWGPTPEAIVAAPHMKPAAAMTAEEATRLFGQIVVEPEWAQLSPTLSKSQLARLEAAPPIPLPRLDPFPPSFETATPPVATAEPEGPPLPPGREVARLEENAPLPPPRPREFGTAAREPERRLAPPPPPPPPADNGNILQKMFGWMHPALPSPSAPPDVASRPAAPPVVASIAPESRTAVKAEPAAPGSGDARGGRGWFSGFMSRSNPTASYDGYTAVYDISTHTVYMPSGARLEAHSGLGERLDDPRYVHERARGATPPHLYELTMRESLFHGVQALRLTPIGEGGVYGRAGLLAHPYMLGPNGASNGCVSVKDYAEFLRAYESGQIKRLAVVASL